MFKSTHNKGFHIELANGVTVSVQFGYTDYCENYNEYELADLFYKQTRITCPNAEVAIWDKNGKWITNKFFNIASDKVAGYIGPGRLVEALQWAKEYKTEEE